MMRTFSFLFVLLLPTVCFAQAKLKPEEVPTFQLRGRITACEEKDPGQKKFTLRLSGGNGAANVTGSAWSEWLKFDKSYAEATLKGYPALYMRGYPVVVKLSVNGVVDPTKIEAELKFDEGDTFKLQGELFGPTLGIMLWRDEAGKPQAATMAVYNQRYWKVLESVKIPEEQRPKKFPIVDRFIGGDDDRLAWKEGIEQLAKAGFSVLMLPPNPKIRELLLATGIKRTAWAVYSPPGYAFDHGGKADPETIAKWAESQATPYLKAGYAKEDMAMFTMSDEPGWYFPRAFEPLEKNPEAMKRFHAYLKEQKLEPADVGAKSWDEVKPLGRSQAKDLASRRLFYWTMRFFSYDSSRHFAECTRALEKAFYPGMPVVTNWNFFSGRLYVPGPVANNSEKQSPDAAMGGHDWLEFGRLRGGTMLWTEDWFGDGQAYQWSFYCAKLRCAAEKGDVQFGSYVIPRTAGGRAEGIIQKILCITGSGGKTIKYFVFGPEYNFPGNCYSEKAKVLPEMAEAHRMIGASEELLWPGKRPRPQVAILSPRSSQMWDAKGIEIPKQISDATNNNLNRATVDYMAEVFDLYLALQHANVPVDFVEEEDLSPTGLKSYKVLYVTEPNIPAELQASLAEWVKGGGTLVTVASAGSRDRFDEPCSVLAKVTGIVEKPHERVLIASLATLKEVAKHAKGDFSAIGVRTSVETAKEDVVLKFADDAPALIRRTVGKGQVVHFPWLPGLSYMKSSTTTKDGLPSGFSSALRDLIVEPVTTAKVQLPIIVDQVMIETPLLLSKEGAAVTVLNWTGEKQKEVTLTIRVPFKVKKLESVKQGKLGFKEVEGGIQTTMPLGNVDILLVRP